MRWPSDIPGAEIDRLLNGHAPEDSGLDGVAQFLADLDLVAREAPTPALEASHVAAMLETARVLAENPGTAADALDPALAVSARKHASVLGNIAAHKWVTATVISVVGLLAFGGAAYAGVLPEPVQEATSSIVRYVGITIPKTHRVKVAGNNGVRDHGAGVGRGKGQGGIHRNTTNNGQASTTTLGTSGVAGQSGVNASSVASATPKGVGTASAKSRSAIAAAKLRARRAKAATRARKHVVKKKAKARPKTSASATKKPSSVEEDRGTGKDS